MGAPRVKVAMRGAGAPKARAWGAAAVAAVVAVVAAGALTALGAAGAAAPGGGPEGGGGGGPPAPSLYRYKELAGGPEGFDAALQGPPAPRGVTVALLGPGEW